MKDQVPADWHDKVIHARLVVDGRVLMGSDAPPAHYATPQGFSVSVSVTDPAAGERIFTALVKDGKVEMPFQKTFWSAGFGMGKDRFGIAWMVNCEPAA
jgi:PhnB protein